MNKIITASVLGKAPAAASLLITGILLTGMVIQGYPNAPKGILIGNSWNSTTRELDVVFAEQTVLDLGTRGVKKVQVWTEIIDCEGKEFTWVVEYNNGFRQEIISQKIRYDRFRTYIEKTFRRKIWNSNTKELMDISGECRIMLLDKELDNNIVALKKIIIK